jgi:uncharacterized membrane protein HdeD (DUF308 family)
MEPSLARNWWVLLIRGILAILFGILVIVWPALAWIYIVASFAAYALIDGIFALASAFNGRGGNHWWALVLEGIVGITAGVLTFLFPAATELVLLWFIAFWAIGTGIFEMLAAFRMRMEVEGEWLLALSGILSVVFGVALILVPGAGALMLAWLVAAYALVFGVLMVGLALRLLSWRRRHPFIVR